jgi:hypothetical protein
VYSLSGGLSRSRCIASNDGISPNSDRKKEVKWSWPSCLGRRRNTTKSFSQYCPCPVRQCDAHRTPDVNTDIRDGGRILSASVSLFICALYLQKRKKVRLCCVRFSTASCTHGGKRHFLNRFIRWSCYIHAPAACPLLEAGISL